MSAQNVTRPGVSAATIIDSPDRAERLAEHLLDAQRSKPVVVITAAAGQSAPYIDVDQIIRDVSELADVYVLPTGSITVAMASRLPEKTQVYGGAGRVYPVHSAWQANPYAAPLRFAFGPAQGPAATEKLIADALGAAHAAGLDIKGVGATVVRVAGRVEALFPPSCAVVRTDDDRHATIWQDLLLPGLPIERAFQVGMRIGGLLDVDESRIDVSASLRKPGEALAGYPVGAVVLGRVVTVDTISACVELYPGARPEMSATEVTGNPLDRLTTLMSVGEVLPVRVTARGGHDGRGWHLSMLDVEDSEEPLASPGLLPGGPPWLVVAEAAPETAPGVVESPAELVEPAVDPALSPPESLPSNSPKGDKVTDEPPAQIDDGESLLRRIARLEGQVQQLRTSKRALQVELDGFREQSRELFAEVQRLGETAGRARTSLRVEKQKSQQLDKKLRAAKAAAPVSSPSGVLFTDPERQFSYDVEVEYAHRIPAAEKAIRPRRELRLGPEFLSSLKDIEGVDRRKVVAVTVEVITDLVATLESRGLHPLREGRGAAEHDVVRAGDGARCMRVALQRKTPSARRLHYWKIGEAIELSRVVKHDDMTP
jgi:hypothetical protein